MKTLNIKKFAIIAILLGMVGFAFAPATNKIVVKGSDTLVILAQKWAEVYMKSNPRHSYTGNRRWFRSWNLGFN